MAIQFDPTNKRIILDSAYVSAAQMYSRWKEWAQTGDNLKHDQAFYALGGDPLGGGLFVASYFFLMNGWKIRPMEANHLLVIDGNIGVYGGGSAPVVNTLGPYNVSVQYTVPVQAQGVATNGGNVDINQIIAAMQQMLDSQILKANLVQIKEKNLNLMTENGWE
jgi:hypothetical protein